MGFENVENKVRAVVGDATGKLKETVGRTTGREDLQVEGRIEQIEADLRRAAERAKNRLAS